MAMASLGIFRFRDAWGLPPLLGAGDRRSPFPPSRTRECRVYWRSSLIFGKTENGL